MRAGRVTSRRGPTVPGALRPEFSASAFGGAVGQGRYYIQYRSDYQVLVITERSPLGLDNAVLTAGVVVFLFGLVLAATGGYVLYGRDE